MAETQPEIDVVEMLATALAARRRAGRAQLIGIAGPQGSGKSTLAAALATRLQGGVGLRVAVLGLDDLYLPKATRAALAQQVHPLLATRGVPGTHDVALGHKLIDALLHGDAPVALPVFDKSRDDRAAEPRIVDAPVDVLLFEGWCIGARPQSAAALARPVNALEAQADPHGIWRRWVNARLAADYVPLFAKADALVWLQTPAYATALAWRQQQEAELRAATGRGMSMAEVADFMAHYERLSRAMRRSLPRRADYVVSIDRAHRLTGLKTKGLRRAGLRPAP
ncbi:kinase [Polymorphobacter arshaanensis]|uniref:kinase n=1 Tax=Glacieibacterium arshaanense TaxID=2511025 RepID=UPI00140BA873|nr:kinase [Polymorphobacter arshaanensis]